MSDAGEEPRPGILRLAGPLVVSFWLRSAFAWVDTIYASYLRDESGAPIGDQSIAAIGLTLPFEFLMIACWVGTSNGLTSRLAAAMGARESEKVEQLKHAALRIIYVLCGLFLALSGFLWWRPEALGLSLEPVLLEQFRQYAAVLLAGSAFTSFWSILPDSLVKAHHDTRTTMWSGLLSGVTNVVLNTVFVFVFHWGILGIALSTVIGRITGLGYATWRAGEHERVRREREIRAITGSFPRPVLAILAIAVPSGITYVLMAVESLVLNWLLAQRPDATSLLASWSIFDRAVRFMAMPVIATAVAMLPLAARRWGERDVGAIRRELRTAFLWTAGYAVLVTLPLAALAGGWVARELSESELTREATARALWYLPFTVLGMSPLFLVRSVFDGMQKPRPGLVVSLLRAAVFVLPLVLLGMHLAPAWGYREIEGVCVGFTLGATLASALISWWAHHDLRRAGTRTPTTA